MSLHLDKYPRVYDCSTMLLHSRHMTSKKKSKTNKPKKQQAKGISFTVTSDLVKYGLIVLLLLAGAILFMQPHHFSFTAIFVVIFSIIGLRITPQQKVSNTFLGLMLGVATITVLFTKYVYDSSTRDLSALGSGCVGFFGVHESCFDGIIYPFAEMVSSILIFFAICTIGIRLLKSRKV